MSRLSGISAMNPATVDHDAIQLKIGCLLSSSYELIENIQKRLNYQDLNTATQVCQAWSSVGNTILKKRRLRFITLYLDTVLTSDSEARVTKSQFEALEDFLEQSSSTTQSYLGFAYDDWLFRNDIVTKYSPNGTSLSCLMKKALPKCCKFALVNTLGIVGSVEKKFLCPPDAPPSSPISSYILPRKTKGSLTPKQSEEGPSKDGELSSEGKTSLTPAKNFNDVGYSIEFEGSLFTSNVSGGLSLVLLPKQPGVHIEIIKVEEKDICSYFKPPGAMYSKGIEMPEENFNRLCGLTPEDELKAFLIFNHTHKFRRFTISMIEAALSRQKDNLALGGGLLGIPQEDSFKGIFAVAVCGSNVRTASIIVPATVKSEVNLKTHLQKLKDYGLPEEHSICFMFSCCGRGSYWYGKNNVETKAFRELFPVTPILGFFGEGEIGTNYPTASSQEERGDGHIGNPRKKRKNKKKLLYQYSSVFVFISFL